MAAPPRTLFHLKSPSNALRCALSELKMEPRVALTPDLHDELGHRAPTLLAQGMRIVVLIVDMAIAFMIGALIAVTLNLCHML